MSAQVETVAAGLNEFGKRSSRRWIKTAHS